MMCSMMTMASTRCRSALMTSMSSRISDSTSPAPISSMSRMRGSSASARASSSRLSCSSVRSAALACADRRQTEVVQDRLAVGVDAEVALGAAAVVARDEQVLEHRHLAERARDLVRAADAHARPLVRRQVRDVDAVVLDGPAVGVQGAAQHADDRALAGAVGADDAEHLAAADLDARPRTRPRRRRSVW